MARAADAPRRRARRLSGRFSKEGAGGGAGAIQPAVGRPSGKKASLASTDGVGTELNDIGMNARL